MTREEAFQWSKAQGGEFHAGTVVVSSQQRADSIMKNGFSLAEQTTGRTWGDGVYIGLGWDSEAFYAREKRDRTMRNVADVLGEETDSGTAGRKPPGQPVTLEVAAVLKHPLVLRYGALQVGEHGRLLSLMDLVQKMYPAEARQLILREQNMNAAATKLLQRHGYDGIQILMDDTLAMTPLTRVPWQVMGWVAVGGQQIVVFDPKQVTVTKARQPNYE